MIFRMVACRSRKPEVRRIATGCGRIGALCCIVALAGCGTFSGRTGSSSTTPESQSTTDVPQKRGGGYYLDDGPGANAPANLDEVQDAIPRHEPLHRGTSRAYTVMGRSFTPMTELAPYRERGVATWYGRRYHGQRTASGEVYDMYAMTAAHTVLPIPSYARVTNLANGRSVVVRINDRGPFLAERLIDVSYVAAHKLDIVRNGSALVEVETVFAGSETMASSSAAVSLREAPSVAAIKPEVQAILPAEDESRSLTGPGEHYLQLGAFALRDNAERFLERIRTQLAGTDAALKITSSGDLHRVRAGPYASRATAMQAAERISQTLGAAPILSGPR